MALTLRPGVSTADTDHGTTLLDERSGEYYTLNPTGALVLHTLLGGGTPAEAARALTERYAVDPETAEGDVADLVGGLRAARLVADR